MEVHERVLMDLGYLEERTYVIKDLTYSRQMRWLARELKLKFATGGRVNRYNMLEPAIARIVSASTNSVVIRGVREEMPTWDKVAEEFRAVPLAKSD